MSQKPKPRIASRTSGPRLKTTTKPVAAGVEIAVTDPLDLWYLCEKASYARATPYLRAKDGHPMYQRTVSYLVRLDNENFKYRFPYCGEVGYDMGKSPPQPIMSKQEPYRPSRFPLSQYQQIRNRHIEQLTRMRVETDRLSKSDLEEILSPSPPIQPGMIWIDTKKKIPGLLRIPDVVRLRSFSTPSKVQYSQGNLTSVIEMKFPGDVLPEDQREAYTTIAGNINNLRILRTKQCESGDRQHWREWVRANVKEPVYKPVNQVTSLASRASIEKHKLLVGQIDAEHEAARYHLEFQISPLGHQLRPTPDPREILAQNQRASAAIGISLAAPFIAVGTAVITAASLPSIATAEGGALIANVGGQSVRFKPFIDGVIKKFAVGASGTSAAVPAFAKDSVHSGSSNLTSEQKEANAKLAEWEYFQHHHETTIHNYILWTDTPE